MGWNQAIVRREHRSWTASRTAAYFYFVHSYYVVPEDDEIIAIETDYHRPFCAMVWRDNLYATQFHPEKSQTDGLKILKNLGTCDPPGRRPRMPEKDDGIVALSLHHRKTRRGLPSLRLLPIAGLGAAWQKLNP